MLCCLILCLILAAATAFPSHNVDSFDIIGGQETSISRYPFAAALLFMYSTNVFSMSCGGTIVSRKAILSAAHCFVTYSSPALWRIRLGSSHHATGGTVYAGERIISHPSYNFNNHDMDIAVLRVKENIVFGNNVAAATIAPANYNVPDDQPVWAIGWGTTDPANGQSMSPVLRHVQIKTVNLQVCARNYAQARYTLTNNMICSGLLGIGGKDQCQGDSGGPLIYNNIVVGVCSFGHSCALPQYPGVNARVASASQWIMSNAN